MIKDIYNIQYSKYADNLNMFLNIKHNTIWLDATNTDVLLVIGYRNFALRKI
jgi:hypothetical protein